MAVERERESISLTNNNKVPQNGCGHFIYKDGLRKVGCLFVVCNTS